MLWVPRIIHIVPHSLQPSDTACPILLHLSSCDHMSIHPLHGKLYCVCETTREFGFQDSHARRHSEGFRPGRSVTTMSVPLAPAPAEDLILPVPASVVKRVETARGTKSANSSRSQLRALKGDSSSQVSTTKFARHTLGILLLLVTVVLWTASNFLASVKGPYTSPFQQMGI